LTAVSRHTSCAIRRNRWGVELPSNIFIQSPQGEQELIEHRKGFNFETYRQNFAAYRFTHIRGIRELMDVLLLDKQYESLDLVQGYMRARRRSSQVPTQWKNALGKKADWAECHGNQIDQICAGVAARLDRNLQAALALALLYKESTHPHLRQLDIFRYLRFAPAIYSIANMPDIAIDWLKGDGSQKHKPEYEDLITALCPTPSDAEGVQRERAKTFLADAAAGYPMTYPNAELIRSRFQSDWTGAKITLLKTRMDMRKLRPHQKMELRCCKCESEFVRLDAEALKSLRKIAENKGRSQGIA
jgi:hypothetical protein